MAVILILTELCASSGKHVKFNPRIFGAFLFGAGLVAFAYFGAPGPATTDAQDDLLGVVVAQAPERSHIPETDSDKDGVPDWREQFQIGKPIVIVTDATSTKKHTEDTLTGDVAKDLLADVIEHELRGPFGTSKEMILYKASSKIAEAATDTLYTESALTTTADTSVESLRAYGNNVAAIMAADLIPEGTREELDIITDAVENEDPAVLEELTPIIGAYKTGRDIMLTMTVPTTMTKEHLNILNAYNALMIDTQGMYKAFDDPLYAMARLKRYHDDVLGLHNAIVILYRTLHESGVRWDKTDTVSKVITVKE